MIPPSNANKVLARIDDVLAHTQGRDPATQTVMETIARHLTHYRWVGVYVLNGGMLLLGPYVGAETEHTAIPVGVGVCGTAVATGQNQVVSDVRTLDNYLACSLDTRSEIVVLIRDGQTGEIIGQIDADGHESGAFDHSDEAFLTEVAARLAPRLLLPAEG